MLYALLSAYYDTVTQRGADDHQGRENPAG